MYQLRAYHEARAYAFKLKPQDSVDLVHDAYVTWWDKTKRSLFDEHRGVITSVLLNKFRSNYGRRTYMSNGIVRVRQFISKDDIIDERSAYEFGILETPESIFIFEELESNIYSDLSPIEKRVYNYVKKGYKKKEIGIKLNISSTTITKYSRKVTSRVSKVVLDKQIKTQE